MRNRTLQSEGFVVARAVLTPAQILAADTGLAVLSSDAAGTRNLLRQPWCQALVDALRSHAAIEPLLPRNAVAVQCTLFEKSRERNWLVPSHQDLSIPVRARHAHPSLGGWSQKEGTLYVHAPVDLLEELLAVRVHIDDCGIDNGALRVVPGSHRAGRLSEAAIVSLRTARGEQHCPMRRGGALIMRPLWLHASSKATLPNRRRVLHFLFAPSSPRYGLEWNDAV